MGDDSTAMAATPSKGDKQATAVEGNAPGGQAFQDNAVASGDDAVLGRQVRPENQLRESDGNRTFANPVTDPGPVLQNGHEWTHPDHHKGETIADVNEPLKIMQRTSTIGAHRDKGKDVQMTDMAPELVAQSGASDIYNKEKGEGLTDMVKAKAAEQRQLAPTSGEPTQGEADAVA